MKLALLLLLGAMSMQAQLGKFTNNFEETDQKVSIRIVTVHPGPRCKHEENCAWMIIWSTPKKAQQVEIALTVAGVDVPVHVVFVPGNATAPRDMHNPVFTEPLSTIRQIDFTLRNKDKVVGTARFK